MDSKPDEFRLLNQQLEHLKKMVARYKQAEEWEKLNFGDKVMIDNSDSLHDGEIGKFITHQWSSSGFVCLLVEFDDGSRHYYLPIHLARHFEVEPMTAKDLDPIRSTPTPTPAPVPESKPEPERKGIDFRKFDPEKLEAEASNVIEAKLAQVAKMPVSTRKKILIGSLPSELIETAVKMGVERGILPA